MFSALRPRLRLAACSLAGFSGASLLPSRRPVSAAHLDVNADPHLWLEEIEGEAALAWCRSENERTIAAVGNPEESATYRKILAIADAKDRVARACCNPCARVWSSPGRSSTTAAWWIGVVHIASPESSVVRIMHT
jgi:hypothetical protein